MQKRRTARIVCEETLQALLRIEADYWSGVPAPSAAERNMYEAVRVAIDILERRRDLYGNKL